MRRNYKPELAIVAVKCEICGRMIAQTRLRTHTSECKAAKLKAERKEQERR